MSTTQNTQRTSQRTSQRPAEHTTPNAEQGPGTKFEPRFKPNFSESFNGNKLQPGSTFFAPIFEPNFSHSFNNNCYQSHDDSSNSNGRGGEPETNGPSNPPETAMVLRGAAPQNGQDHAQYTHRTNGLPRGYSRSSPRGGSIRTEDIYCEGGSS